MKTLKLKRNQVMLLWQGVNILKRLDMPGPMRITLERNTTALEPEVNSVLKIYPNPPADVNGEYGKLMDEEVEVSIRQIDPPEYRGEDLRIYWEKDTSAQLNEKAQWLAQAILPMVKDG